MARTIKEQEYVEKRNYILNAAQKLVSTKGYEQMTIQDVLSELEISSGAFYHYFGSKSALLEALIERITEETTKLLLPILHDADRSALEKLQGFFDEENRMRSAHKGDIVQFVRVWYTDSNAIIRQKVESAVREQRAPLLSTIVHQGIQEGSFTTLYPDQIGEVILSLIQGMENTHAKLLLSLEHEPNKQEIIDAIVTTHAVYMDAIEQVLGAPRNTLYRAGVASVKLWMDALQADH